MNVIKTKIEGLLILEPQIWQDERGYFYETYQLEKFKAFGIDILFVQDNQSLSSKGTLRGLHFQKPPYHQAKLVRVVRGRVLDVAVDLRKGSPTYGHYEKVELSDQNHLQFFIPSGFAHGFLSLEDDTVFTYKCSNYYNKSSEGGLLWNDPEIQIDWSFSSPLVSAKDQILPGLAGFETPFS
jgi:dTDP-4-dehydrorhamnose 3,5-epimerase